MWSGSSGNIRPKKFARSSISLLPAERLLSWSLRPPRLAYTMSVVAPKEAARLMIEGRAPAGLKSGVLQLSLAQTGKPVTIPPGLKCYSLSLVGQQIRSLPAGLQVEYKLDLTD